MDYKKVLKTVLFLLKHPAMAWRVVSHDENVNAMLANFLYPLVMLCGTSMFLGHRVGYALCKFDKCCTVFDVDVDCISCVVAVVASIHRQIYRCRLSARNNKSVCRLFDGGHAGVECLFGIISRT